jgi:two-component system LytT family response regulator
MKVIIIEDESLLAKSLQRLLLEIEPGIKVLAVLDSVASSVNWLNTNPHPDLLFADIQLSDGVSFDIFNKVKIDKPVIFTTAYNDYAIRAFKVNSVDYLLKPIDKDYLHAALQKFKHHYQNNHDGGITGQLKELMQTLANPAEKKYKERFLAHYKSGIVPLPESKVACFIKDTIIYLVTTDNEKLVTDYNTIDEIEEVVNPAKFFRANRQSIIHINEVETYKKHDTGKIEVHLKCDKSLHIDISREKANDFVNWLDQ